MIPIVLVATDGKPGAAGALRAARALEERDGARVRALAVYEPPPQFYGLEAAGMVAGVPSPFGAAEVEALRRVAEVQLAGAGGAHWSLEVTLGGAAPAIAREAARSGAGLILLGLRPHAPVERWLGRETLLRLTHLSHVPVLAVPADVRALPRRAVVAVDLSERSLRAARVAPEVMDPGGELHLVHATWAPSRAESWSTMDWVKAYRDDVEERVEALAAELRASGGPSVRVHVRESTEPADEVVRLADELEADLIVAGSHGHGYLGRLVMGSTSGKLLHGAHCAVMIVPPAEVPRELDASAALAPILAPLGGAG